MRLVDENNSLSVVGRVEYCIGGVWGTVCNWLWSENDAAVVCRQLRLEAIAGNLIEVVTYYTLITKYSYIDQKVLNQRDVPQVSDIRTPIVLDGLECLRNDIRLDECQHFKYVQECSHLDDAGANCSNTKGWLRVSNTIIM